MSRPKLATVRLQLDAETLERLSGSYGLKRIGDAATACFMLGAQARGDEFPTVFLDVGEPGAVGRVGDAFRDGKTVVVAWKGRLRRVNAGTIKAGRLLRTLERAVLGKQRAVRRWRGRLNWEGEPTQIRSE